MVLTRWIAPITRAQQRALLLRAGMQQPTHKLRAHANAEKKGTSSAAAHQK
jgi:hypothetical protein